MNGDDDVDDGDDDDDDDDDEINEAEMLKCSEKVTIRNVTVLTIKMIRNDIHLMEAGTDTRLRIANLKI